MLDKQSIINAINEEAAISQIGTASADAISQSFKEKIDSYGYTSVEVEAVLFTLGYCVSFTDLEGDQLVTFFVNNGPNDCYCFVVNQANEIVIDISPAKPMILSDSNYIDYEGAWMNKSFIDAIFAESSINEEMEYFDYVEGDAPDETPRVSTTTVLRGGSKVSLPIMYVNNDEYTDFMSYVIELIGNAKPHWFPELYK